MILLLITLAGVANAAKLHRGLAAPRGAAEAGGGQFLSSPEQNVPSPSPNGLVNGPPPENIAILSFALRPHYTDGTYFSSYQGQNGIQVEETGLAPGPDAGSSVQGIYSYVSPEGKTINLSYTAGESGFIPQGDHIPTPPPIPKEILDVIAKNAADEAAGIFDDGKYKGN